MIEMQLTKNFFCKKYVIPNKSRRTLKEKNAGGGAINIAIPTTNPSTPGVTKPHPTLNIKK
jgi:hypothetical protein